MAELREQHFAAAGIERRDFMIYLYPAARAFVAAARAGQAASPGFDDALRAHALVEAAYRSADSGQPVDLTGDLGAGSSSS